MKNPIQCPRCGWRQPLLIISPAEAKLAAERFPTPTVGAKDVLLARLTFSRGGEAVEGTVLAQRGYDAEEGRFKWVILNEVRNPTKVERYAFGVTLLDAEGDEAGHFQGRVWGTDPDQVSDSLTAEHRAGLYADYKLRIDYIERIEANGGED